MGPEALGQAGIAKAIEDVFVYELGRYLPTTSPSFEDAHRVMRTYGRGRVYVVKDE